ncbi:MAG TPA: flagellar biosynthetic protein FliR [Gaiellaceae bacterium]|nr:flagellar biosynthetic protein FliR [Gaiellaceae bacterium]
MNFQLPGGLSLPETAGTQVVAFVLVMGRVAPLFLLAPVFSANLLAQRAKFLAAAAISVSLTPLASQGRTVPTDPLAFSLTLAQEVGIGLAFALALGALAAAVSAGAALVDTLVGFSFGAIVDPMNGNQNAILGQVYSLFALMIFVVFGGIGLMIMGLAKTYSLIPLGAMPSTSAFAGLALHSIEQVPLIGLELAAPVLLAVIVADAVFGIVARAVPQMNVLVLGLPAKVLLSFAVIGASLPFVGLHLEDDLTHTLSSSLQAFTH